MVMLSIRRLLHRLRIQSYGYRAEIGPALEPKPCRWGCTVLGWRCRAALTFACSPLFYTTKHRIDYAKHKPPNKLFCLAGSATWPGQPGNHSRGFRQGHRSGSCVVVCWPFNNRVTRNTDIHCPPSFGIARNHGRHHETRVGPARQVGGARWQGCRLPARHARRVSQAHGGLSPAVPGSRLKRGFASRCRVHVHWSVSSVKSGHPHARLARARIQP